MFFQSQSVVAIAPFQPLGFTAAKWAIAVIEQLESLFGHNGTCSVLVPTLRLRPGSLIVHYSDTWRPGQSRSFACVCSPWFSHRAGPALLLRPLLLFLPPYPEETD